MFSLFWWKLGPELGWFLSCCVSASCLIRFLVVVVVLRVLYNPLGFILANVLSKRDTCLCASLVSKLTLICIYFSIASFGFSDT